LSTYAPSISNALTETISNGTVSSIDYIVIIAMENKDYSSVLGSAQAVAFARSSTACSASQYERGFRLFVTQTDNPHAILLGEYVRQDGRVQQELDIMSRRKGLSRTSTEKPREYFPAWTAEEENLTRLIFGPLKLMKQSS